MIKMLLIGHLGQDATVRDVANSNQTAISFSVAHTEKYKDAQGVQHERTTWVSCTLWREHGKTAIANYLKKGQQVYVEGDASAVPYTGRDGQPRADLRMRVMNVQLLGSTQQAAAPYTPPAPQAPADTRAANGFQPYPAQQAATPVSGEDDLPF